MKVKDITKTDDIDASIKILKFNAKDLNIGEYKKQYGIEGHKVLDTSERQDKVVKIDENDTRLEKVGRIPISFQKKIVSAATSFAFGNPVELHSEPKTDNQKVVLEAIETIFDDNKIDSFNRKMCKEILRSTQFAEIWHISEQSEEFGDYGFPTKMKLRVTAISPWDDNKLYPFFGLDGDLIAFSRHFSYKEIDGKVTEYFETYTDEETVIWSKKQSEQFVEIKRSGNQIKKIPVVFGRDENVDWADVQPLIERLEWLLSNFADTNDYHGSPTIFTQGTILGFAKKGESGKIIQGDQGATAQYLSWANAPESVRLEIETLFKLIFSLTQTPDISFESVKGLGAISGVALKMLFLDAHLKVKDKQSIFDDYLKRRINVVKAFVGQMSTSLAKDAKSLKITPKIVPFMVLDEKAKIDNLLAANGNQPLISQKNSIAQSGMVDDAEEEYKLIQQELQSQNSVSLFPTAI